MFKFLLVRRASVIGAAPECTKALAFSDGNQTTRRSLCSAAREDYVIFRSRYDDAYTPSSLWHRIFLRILFCTDSSRNIFKLS